MTTDDDRAVVALTVAYCWALDTKDFDALRTVFATDATARYGGDDLADVEAVVLTCRRVLTPLDLSQHLVTNHEVHVDGDRATSRCYFHAQHVRRAAPGGANFVVAGRYEDDLVRTPDGWRIAHRVLTTMWTEGNPAVVRPA